jgi:hypothetical protein
MKYQIRTIIRNAGSVEQLEPEEGTLLVGEIVLQYEDKHFGEGCEYIRISPAFKDGQRCFFKTSEWWPGQGYCAEGIQDTILTYEDGLDILVQKGMFEGLFHSESK